MSHLSSPVLQFHWCASNKEETEEEVRPTNHWMIFLQTGPNSSVRLNMRSGESSQYPGLLEVSSTRYAFTQNCCFRVSAAAVPGLTVEHVFSLVIRNGRDRYKFTDSHEGCRHWVNVIASDLSGASWMESGVAQRVSQAVVFYFPPTHSIHGAQAPVYRPLEVGTFF
ncbi:hypothetical protein EDD18DRAFT_202617 [Armillaria luteobubalina]|uniref:DUF7770 domain-containing protein n=1 Tax=Armillaria luteobubalina TaxID=153913 RepID=A0AA39UT60_9AGAR|nr:hypothetical protein EDD18DRAFT_202617 [Armillaria luteobubalina]